MPNFFLNIEVITGKIQKKVYEQFPEGIPEEILKEFLKANWENILQNV